MSLDTSGLLRLISNLMGDRSKITLYIIIIISKFKSLHNTITTAWIARWGNRPLVTPLYTGFGRQRHTMDPIPNARRSILLYNSARAYKGVEKCQIHCCGVWITIYNLSRLARARWAWWNFESMINHDPRCLCRIMIFRTLCERYRTVSLRRSR